MYKVWGKQYSFINNNGEITESIKSNYKDNDKNYKKGYNRKVVNDHVDEKFYKYKNENSIQKKILGKSSDKNNWEILEESDGIRTQNMKNYHDFTFGSQFKAGNNHKNSLLPDNKILDLRKNKEEFEDNEYDNTILDFFNSKQLGHFFDVKHINEFNYDDMFNDDFFKY